ncbi:MAG: adenylate/guanylate cyclase domain-containing protein [Crocinitomicaceae bacterium]
MKKAISTFLLIFFISANALYSQSSSNLYNEGLELREDGKKNKAIKKIEAALDKAQAEENLSIQMACHIELAEMMDNVISYKEALSHYKSFTELYKKQSLEQTSALKDSVSGLHVNLQENSEEISAQGKALDSLTTEQMRSQLDISKLELDKEKHLKEIQASKYRRNFLLFTILLVVIVMLFVFLGYSRKKKNNKTLRNKNYQIVKEKEKSEELLLNILPPLIADQLKVNGKTIPSKYEMATIMFTDFKGFTKFSESRSPEDLVTVIDYYFSNFDKIIDKYPIEKIKTIGDAYLCVSGIPEENPNQIEDMINCAKELQAFVRKAQEDDKTVALATLSMRIGIHSGPLVAGVVGTRKFAYDVWGDAVNIAARMEQSGMPGEINVSEEVYTHAKDKFNFEFRGEVEAKNKGILKMYFVKD